MNISSSLMLFLLFVITTTIVTTTFFNNNRNSFCFTLAQGGGYDSKGTAFNGISTLTASDTLPTNVEDNNYGYFVTYFEPLSYAATGFVPFPIILVPIHFAFSQEQLISDPNQHLTLEISLETLGAWMMQTIIDTNKTLTPSTSTDVPVGLAQLKLVIATDSKTTRTVIYRMWEQNIPGFTSPYALPPEVLTNPNISFVTSDDGVVAALNNTSTITSDKIVVGFLAGLEGHHFPSFAVSVSDAPGDLKLSPSSLPLANPDRFSLVNDESLPVPAMLNLTHRTNFNITYLRIPTDPIYPLTGVVYENTPLITNCSAPNSFNRAIAAIQSLNRIFGIGIFDTRMLVWNMLPIPTSLRSLLIGQSLELQQTCVPVSALSWGGSTAITSLTYRYAIRYLATKSIVARYLPYGSLNAAARVYDGTLLAAATENLPTPAERAAHPTHGTFAFTTFAISIIFNIPNVDQLFVPRCRLLALFNRTIQYFDELQQWNPATKLPHVKINLIIPNATSGTLKVFNRGLKEIDAKCSFQETGIVSPSNVIVDENWNLAVDEGFDSAPAAIEKFRNTPFSIALAAAPAVKSDPSLTEVLLFNESSYTTSSSKAEAIENALSEAYIVNEETGELDLSVLATSPLGYPWISVSYILVDLHATENCVNMRRTLEMLYWQMTDDEAQELALENGFVPFPDFIKDDGLRKLASSTCGGLYVFPHLVHNTTELDLKPIIAGSVTGFVVLVAVFVAVSWYLANRGKRSAKYAAKDNTTPFALVFTDIQASTTLWSVAPQAMAVSLDLHNEIIERNIERFDGYKVKTIGDAYMICVKDVKKAHEMCLSIQRDLFYAEWPSDEIDMAYADLFQDEESLYQMYNADGTELTYKQRKKLRGAQSELYANRTNPSLFHGVSVRIGMTYGVAEPKLDEVTNSYDYFGPNVNLASRCESCGNGGQTIYSVHAIEALRDAGIDLTDAQQLSVTALGKQPLKGIPAPIELYQVLPSEFSGRKFPPLRLEKDGTMTLELESETTDTTTTGNASSSMNYSLSQNTTKNSTASAVGASSVDNHSNSQSGATTNSHHHHTDKSHTSTNDGTGGQGSSLSEDEEEAKLPKDLRFARYLALQSSVDPRLLLLVYDTNRAIVAATTSDRARKQMIDKIANDWRVQDFKTKPHLFFKKELGYEEYWCMRISQKILGLINNRQKKRDPKNIYKCNIMRRGALVQDENDKKFINYFQQGSSSMSTDGSGFNTAGITGSTTNDNNSNKHNVNRSKLSQTGDSNLQTMAPMILVQPFSATPMNAPSHVAAGAAAGGSSGDLDNHLYHQEQQRSATTTPNTNNNNLSIGSRQSKYQHQQGIFSQNATNNDTTTSGSRQSQHQNNSCEHDDTNDGGLHQPQQQQQGFEHFTSLNVGSGATATQLLMSNQQIVTNQFQSNNSNNNTKQKYHNNTSSTTKMESVQSGEAGHV